MVSLLSHSEWPELIHCYVALLVVVPPPHPGEADRSETDWTILTASYNLSVHISLSLTSAQTKQSFLFGELGMGGKHQF